MRDEGKGERKREEERGVRNVYSHTAITKMRVTCVYDLLSSLLYALCMYVCILLVSSSVFFRVLFSSFPRPRRPSPSPLSHAPIPSHHSPSPLNNKPISLPQNYKYISFPLITGASTDL